VCLVYGDVNVVYGLRGNSVLTEVLVLLIEIAEVSGGDGCIV